ncbi:coiled-coil domain-containing protein 30 [Rhinatrema bivittatum]|uniref:coiled-coil domain-containing protein 30 n=1 Tax=Rhinatrema bivittatum TaxID=194408 RepID=UPI00112AC465|nr:coiled-coil domain-containing protein 30 [Rhinatrema bivittatum]XP_029434855.1 coiled-coil domain-containing protein 30 [Rhinatrema bivittatum]
MDKSHVEKVQVEDILDTLKEEGLDPCATSDERLSYLWCLYQRSEGKLWSASQDLEELRRQQAEEMKDVENYVDHVRNLTEEREGLASKFEKENEQLRTELEHLRLQHEAQAKEVEEMLDQEGLSEIAHSNPSEQIAYLLVERATVLERLDLMEENLDFHKGGHQESHLQTCDEDLEKEKKLRECVERDLDEAAHRLHMAHDEIRRLTDELDMRKEQNTFELQKARDHNNRLDKEILALRSRVRSLDLDRKEHAEMIEKLKEEIHGYQKKEEQRHLSPPINDTAEHTEQPLQDENSKGDVEEEASRDEADSAQLKNFQSHEALHKRCQQEIEDKEYRNKELVHKFKKLEHEYEELVERNEELESVLGETQNRRKEENEHFECETEGLKRKITSLEAELSEMRRSREELCFQDQETNSNIVKMEALQQMLKNSQENIEILDSRLSEEKAWRQQLESDLETAQKALRAEKEELQTSKSEIKCLQNEITGLKETAKEQLQRDNPLLKSQISALTGGYEMLNTRTAGQRKIDKETEELLLTSEKVIQDLTTKASSLEEKSQSLEKEGEILSAELTESKKKTEILQGQLNESIVEKQAAREENAQLKQEVSRTRQQLRSMEEEVVQLKQEINAANQYREPQMSGAGTNSIIKLHHSGETIFRQQQEEVRQLRQDLHRVQNVCSSAEKELRYEREKNLDLKKHNLLLQQENTKVKAEVKQVQGKCSEFSKSCTSLQAELEQSQQKVKELELDVLKQSQSAKLQSSLQEKLAREISKANEADKKALELQQQLKDLRHQLSLSDTHIQGKKQLEEEAKALREHESKLRQQLEAEQRDRKLQDQNIEEFQEHLKSFRNKETALVRTNAELQLRVQQQETRLRILEEERDAISSEYLHFQNSTQKLSEQLSLLQQDKESLYRELDSALKQLDDSVRKHNEKQLRHKAKLRKVKEVYVHEVKHRDGLLKQLQSEIALMRSQTEKEKAWIRKVTTENENLLQEKRCLLQQATDQEEIGRNNRWLLSSIQSRVHFLDEENKQLQDSTIRLSSQVAMLERILKTIQTLNIEELNKVIPSECFPLNDKTLSLPNTSFPAVGLSSSLGILKAIPDAKNEDVPESLKAAFSISHSQPSEISYLNLTSPGETPTFPGEQHGPSVCSDEEHQ